MKLFFKQIFILSGVLPATCLLALTFLALPSLFKNITLRFYDIVIVVSMLFGICGYIGLLISMMPKFEHKYTLKLTFLVLGIIGSCLFHSIFGNGNIWDWILSMEEADEWFIWIWPLVVSIVLVFSDGRKSHKHKAK